MSRNLLFPLMLLLVLIAAGCPKTYQEELATTHLAVISATPWESIKAELAPQFKEFYGSAAEADVLPTTLLSNSATSLLLSGSLGVSMGLGKSDPPNKPSATPQDPPSVSGKLGDQLKDAALGRDPVLVRRLATALVQETVMLNRYVDSALIPEGYRAYVVRLQIGVQTMKHQVKRDVIADIAFFSRNSVHWPHLLLPKPANTQVNAEMIKSLMHDSYRRVREQSKSQGLLASGQPSDTEADAKQSPIVVPMFVTDNIETAMQMQSDYQVYKLALAAAVAAGKLNAGAEVDATWSMLSEVLGRQYNSLFTVARLSDCAIRVRLGANFVGTGSRPEQSLMTQSHYVTLLVMVPDSEADGVVALMRTRTCQDDGKLDLARDASMLSQRIEEIMRDYDPDLARKAGKAYRDHEDKHPAQVLDLFMALQLNHFAWFRQTLVNMLKKGDVRERVCSTIAPGCNDKNELCDRLEALAPLIWLELTSKFCAGRFGLVQIPLPLSRPEVLVEQTALGEDDGKNVTVRLSNAWNLSDQTVMATLSTSRQGVSYSLPAQAVQTDAKHNATLIFPALPPVEKPGPAQESKTTLRLMGIKHDIRCLPTTQPADNRTVIFKAHVRDASKPPEPQPLAVNLWSPKGSVPRIIENGKAHAFVRLYIALEDTADLAGGICLKVKSCAASPVGCYPDKAVVADDKALLIKKDGWVELRLDGIDKVTSVSFTAESASNQKSKACVVKIEP